VLLTKTLRLVTPGLLGPWQIGPGFSYPQTNALAYLLSRATVKSTVVADADALLCKLFGLHISSDKDLPIAALTHLADDGVPDKEGWWLRADPVHLHADIHQVLLFDARNLNVSVEEANLLATEFNQTFNEEGLQLKTPHPSRWYLHLKEDPGIRTKPLSKVVGCNITPFLPYGVNARDWRRRLTEAQMLFHGSAVNRERQTKGQSSINGLWFWGSGLLPDKPMHTINDVIYASDPVTRGLAGLSAVKLKPVPNTAFTWRNESLEERQALIVLESTRYDLIDNNTDMWRNHVDMLERDWFAPCLTMLRNKELNKLVLYPCDGREYSVSHNDLRRFWRRIRPLQHYTQS
jgi:hypothetical protein